MSPYIARLRAAIGHEVLLLPSITVLPRDGDGRLLLVRQSDNGHWGTIGGTVEIGEPPADAAVREAQEEAGVDVELGPILAAVGGRPYEVEYSNGDRTAYVAIVYDARVAGGSPAADGDETTDVGWYTQAELAGLDLDGFARALFAELGLL